MDLLILLLMLFRLFKLLRSIELLVGLMMGIFDFDVIAFSMVLILLDKCVNVKHENMTTNRLNVYLVYIQLLAFTQVSDPFVSKIKSFLFSSHKIPESHTKSGQFYNKIIFLCHSEWQTSKLVTVRLIQQLLLVRLFQVWGMHSIITPVCTQNILSLE